LTHATTCCDTIRNPRRSSVSTLINEIKFGISQGFYRAATLSPML
jgi:hypothetical protein